MEQGIERRRRASDAFQDLFQILVGINFAVVENSEPQGVLDVLLAAAVRLFEVHWCSLGLVDDETHLLFRVHTGDSDLSSFQVAKEKGFAGWVFASGKPVLSNTPQNDPRFDSSIDEQTGTVTQNLMCAPIRFRRHVLGVIKVLNTQKKGGFNQADLSLLASFGELAGVAINSNETLQVADHAGSIYREDARQRYAMVWGKSEAMNQVMATARQVAPTNTTVLLMSESGTGKEMIAHTIHRWSHRRASPFVALNCVTLTPELLGSELFGHEKGAFTGATDRKLGKFELANKGTIFLDEIGELDLELQARLLRVLQEREFQRVGGTQDIHTDVRIIAATNRNLAQAVAAGRFREDLYYRLNVMTLELPPLRQRQQDIPDLVMHFLRICSNQAGRLTLGIEADALAMLSAYQWPGNVRQLRNTIERAVVLTPGQKITTASLPPEIQSAAGQQIPEVGVAHSITRQAEVTIQPLAEALEHFKRQHVMKALRQTGGNQAKAAELLGIKAPNLSRLLKKFRTAE